MISKESISTYIFIHDQVMLLRAKNTNKFKHLPNLKYVFLGNSEVDLISDMEDVIIARKLKNNIEQYTKFCSFTGWYALWKNKLITTEYVNLFEYDIEENELFNIKINSIMSENYEFIGYMPLSMNDSYVINSHYAAPLVRSMNKIYNIDIVKFINSILEKNNNAKWSSTSNCTFRKRTLHYYMKWFMKLVDELKKDRMCGHAHERSISLFCLLHNKKTLITNGLISHLMLNSHKTG